MRILSRVVFASLLTCSVVFGVAATSPAFGCGQWPDNCCKPGQSCAKPGGGAEDQGPVTGSLPVGLWQGVLVFLDMAL